MEATVKAEGVDSSSGEPPSRNMSASNHSPNQNSISYISIPLTSFSFTSNQPLPASNQFPVTYQSGMNRPVPTYFHFNERPNLPWYETPNGENTYYRYEYRNSKKKNRFDIRNADEDSIKHGHIVTTWNKMELYYVDSGDVDGDPYGFNLKDPYVKIVEVWPTQGSCQRKKSVRVGDLVLQCKNLHLTCKCSDHYQYRKIISGQVNSIPIIHGILPLPELN